MLAGLLEARDQRQSTARSILTSRSLGLAGRPPRGCRRRRPTRPNAPRPPGSWAMAPGEDTKDRDLLLGLLRPQVSLALQQAAVAALATTD